MIKKIKQLIIRFFRQDYKQQLWYIGSNVKLPTDLILSGGKNIIIDDNVSIEKGAVLYATNARIVIKKWFIASQNLKIITGDHERRIGRFCMSIKENEKNHTLGLDEDVIINEDVWCGMNVIILKGVSIGRGCTLCAGSVISKSTPPYAIVGGVPAKVIKFYWNIEQIIEHERLLYEPNERYTRSELEALFSKYIDQ